MVYWGCCTSHSLLRRGKLLTHATDPQTETCLDPQADLVPLPSPEHQAAPEIQRTLAGLRPHKFFMGSGEGSPNTPYIRP